MSAMRSTARRAMRSVRQDFEMPHTATNAAIAVMVATMWPVQVADRVTCRMGHASHDTPGKNAVFGIWKLAYE
jgi:hypothetical protein